MTSKLEQHQRKEFNSRLAPFLVQMLENVSERAAADNPIDEKDYKKGKKTYCHKCNTSKTVFRKGKEYRVFCQCAADSAGGMTPDQERTLELRRQQHDFDAPLAAELLSQLDPWKTFMQCKDGVNAELVSLSKSYVENWERMKEKGAGLYFYGDVGSGKSFLSQCIANELKSKGEKVLFTSVGLLIDKAFDVPVRKLMLTADLVVLDDLGTERGSEYGREQEYMIYESRLESKKPLIVTSNLMPSQLKEKAKSNITLARIYDRVFAMCTPQVVEGKGLRRQEMSGKAKEIQQLWDSEV